VHVHAYLTAHLNQYADTIAVPWLRNAAKWALAMMLQAGVLGWGTIRGDRIQCLMRFDRWLATLPDPTSVVGDLHRAGGLAAGFRQWVSDPANRASTRRGRPPTSNSANQDMRAVAQLMAFVWDNHEDYRRRFGPSPWDTLTETHSALWARQITRTRPVRRLDETNYIDDHALAQITAHLAVLAAPKHETVTVTLAGTHKQMQGWGAPQAMRMLLLQILTGRRLSEICLTEFDCLSPATGVALEIAEQDQIARFRYGQSKIDQAPDTILVDAEVAVVIAEQQHWVRDQFPGPVPRYLFPRRNANAGGTKPYARQSYIRLLQHFSQAAQITDSAGKPVHLNHTHRFRHTKLTRLAELGMPVHVLQRYAGHATPTMSMHYVAQREEHAEQAFLATRKFKADGTHVAFSRQDHDGMHLFDRADRFLPNGYCLLPPLQSCDKGNACLTCGVFVTDTTHLDTLNQQLAQTTALIERTAAQFQDRHGMPMPADNVWLTHRTAERDALLRLLAAMQATPGRAVQGAGTPTGPTPVDIDLTRHRKTQP